MGACYDVYLVADFPSKEHEKKAIKVLQDKILIDHHNHRVRYNDEQLEVAYSYSATIADLFNVFLAGTKAKPISHVEGDKAYENSFDACYGWASVICDMFYCIAPLLTGYSYMEVCMDNDSYLMTQVSVMKELSSKNSNNSMQ